MLPGAVIQTGGPMGSSLDLILPGYGVSKDKEDATQPIPKVFFDRGFYCDWRLGFPKENMA